MNHLDISKHQFELYNSCYTSGLYLPIGCHTHLQTMVLTLRLLWSLRSKLDHTAANILVRLFSLPAVFLSGFPRVFLHACTAESQQLTHNLYTDFGVHFSAIPFSPEFCCFNFNQSGSFKLQSLYSQLSRVADCCLVFLPPVGKLEISLRRKS